MENVVKTSTTYEKRPLFITYVNRLNPENGLPCIELSNVKYFGAVGLNLWNTAGLCNATTGGYIDHAMGVWV